jgi:hypothetical protein
VSKYVIRGGRRIEVETLEPKMPLKPKRTCQDQFVRVPLTWVDRLRGARCIGSYRLALHLLFHHWKSDGKPIKLSNVILAGLGVGGGKAKWRALSELERLKLVRIDRRPKRSPVVTILVTF